MNKPLHQRSRHVPWRSFSTLVERTALPTIFVLLCGCTGSVVQNDAGAAGTAGSSTSGALCVPGATRSCYSGPPGTEGIGSCAAGTSLCSSDGSQYGPCQGEVLPAFDDCVTPADEDCDGAPMACTGAPLWANAYATPLPKDLIAGGVMGLGAAVDHVGAVVVAGTFLKEIDFGGGPLHPNPKGPLDYSLFVAKWSADGQLLWSKTFGPGLMYAVAVDRANDVIVSGIYGSVSATGQIPVDFGGGALPVESGASALFVAKLDPNGAHLASFGRPDAHVSTVKVAVDGQDNVFLGGTYAGTLAFDGTTITAAGGGDGFALALDKENKSEWGFGFGTAGFTEEVTGIVVDPVGRATVAGFSASSLDFNGVALTTTASSDDVIVGQIDAAGHTVWARAFGDGDEQFALGVSSDLGGNAIIAGKFSGALDFGVGALTGGSHDTFLAKLDPHGQGIWARAFADDDFSVSKRVTTDPAGHVVFAGGVHGDTDLGGGALTSAGGVDGFIAKYERSSGKHLWSRRFGDAADQVVWDVAVGPHGEAAIVGTFEGTIDVGLGPLMSPKGGIFVAKLAP